MTTTATTTTTTTTTTPRPTAAVTTTTTTTVLATITTSPKARPPTSEPSGGRVATRSWPGNLDYPDNVDATYTITTSGGVVSATAAWSGTPQLTIAVRCAGRVRTASGTTGLYVSAVAAAGTCSVTISELPQSESTISYALVAHYPAPGGAA